MFNYLREIETLDDVKGSVITKEVDKEKQYFIEGIFMQGDVKNRNGRIYPKNVLLAATNRYIEESVKTNMAVGELGHPENVDINHDRVCIKIVSLIPEGSNIIGKAKVTTALPMGKVVKGLIDEGIKFGVSSRALGSLTESQKGKIVGNDLQIITAADIVANPSGQSCYVDAIMENKEWVWNAGKLYTVESQVKDYVNKVSKTGLTEAKIELIFRETLRLL